MADGDWLQDGSTLAVDDSFTVAASSPLPTHTAAHSRAQSYGGRSMRTTAASSSHGDRGDDEDDNDLIAKPNGGFLQPGVSDMLVVPLDYHADSSRTNSAATSRAEQEEALQTRQIAAFDALVVRLATQQQTRNVNDAGHAHSRLGRMLSTSSAKAKTISPPAREAVVAPHPKDRHASSVTILLDTPDTQGQVLYRQKLANMSIVQHALVWHVEVPAGDAPTFESIPMSRIINVKTTPMTKNAFPAVCVFTYCEDTSFPYSWQLQAYTFQVRDESQSSMWKFAILKELEVFERPRRIKVFVNPYSGHKKGVRIYEQVVQPYFELAGLVCDVTVTNRARHAWESLENTDLSNFDAIVCVGGDGTLVECLNGMLNNKALTQPLPVGLIPAGSTDAVAYTVAGYNDPATCALQICLGLKTSVDMLRIDQPNEPPRYSLAFCGYGFFGDAVLDSERFRWMGPARYMWSGFKTFIQLKKYRGTVRYMVRTDSINTKLSARDDQCYHSCASCQSASFNDSEESTAYEWRSVTDKFVSINFANIACASEKTPKGFAPVSHIANGLGSMVLVRNCSRWRYLKFLLRVSSGRSDQFQFDNVDAISTRRMEFVPAEGRTSVWNVDGEIFHEPAASISVVHKGVQLLALQRLRPIAPDSHLARKQTP